MTAFIDYFGTQAIDYARSRPRYPHQMFSWLARLCGARKLAWDCGCGNGQATTDLARHFEWVVANDASSDQLSLAPRLDNVEYRCALAENSGLADSSVDLALAAQALHWFDLQRFYREVKRTLRPGGVFAAVSYRLLKVTPEIDQEINTFFHRRLGRYWPPERRHIENAYQDLPFPFAELHAPVLYMKSRWSFDQLCGYLNTWSALTVYRNKVGEDPLPQAVARLEAVWGDRTRPKTVIWPLTLRVGRHFGKTS